MREIGETLGAHGPAWYMQQRITETSSQTTCKAKTDTKSCPLTATHEHMHARMHARTI